jgi:hypothetical protein
MKPVENPHRLPISILWLPNEIVNDGKGARPGAKMGAGAADCVFQKEIALKINIRAAKAEVNLLRISGNRR